MAKLYELVEESSYEAIVLDTPPSRSAIDLLAAPERLIRFLEGRALLALLRPSGLAVRSAGFALSAVRRITGTGLLDDLATFFRLLGSILDGFRSRAAEVQSVLTDPATGFLVVTSGEPAALDEAIHFAGELGRAGMHRCGVIVNRIQPLDSGGGDFGQTVSQLTLAVEERLANKVARTHDELQLLARRDQASIERLQAALNEPRAFQLADREVGVHDVQALFDLQRELFG
jgi:anion-transporting  ArsA/GET3 family ATPase